MRNCIIILLLVFASTSIAYSDGSCGEKASYDSRYIIDMPNVGVLPKGTFAVYTQFFEQGGIMTELVAAPFENFNMGISFSGSNIVSSGDVTWQGIPGIQLRYRFINETSYFPAFIAGISTQGRGAYNKNDERFTTLSPGVFFAAGKSFRWALGIFSVHGGANYSFEPLPDNRSPNIYIGVEHSISGPASFNIEYNSNFDDSNVNYTDNKGLLNMGFRLAVARGLTFEFLMRDMFSHKRGATGFTRYFGVEFIGAI